MQHLWKGIAIGAIWTLVGAIALRFEGVSHTLIIILAVLALLGTWGVAEAGFKNCKCPHCTHGEDDDD